MLSCLWLIDSLRKHELLISDLFIISLLLSSESMNQVKTGTIMKNSSNK